MITDTIYIVNYYSLEDVLITKDACLLCGRVLVCKDWATNYDSSFEKDRTVSTLLGSLCYCLNRSLI